MADELRTIIACDKRRASLEAFLQDRFAWENFGFYMAVENYKEMYDSDDTATTAQQIFEEFVAPGAPNELGEIDLVFRKQVAENMQNPPKDLFNCMQYQAFNILAQTMVKDFIRHTAVPRRSSSEPIVTAHAPKKRSRSLRLPSLCGKAPSSDDDNDEVARPASSSWKPKSPLFADQEGVEEVMQSITSENCKKFDTEQPATFGFLSLVQDCAPVR
eukprot:CAMPEP_0114634150 /NCGR_PEP_ID=MMETSP0168-20121206/15825_1 /TAXON_ID=95228 ORGANISM="Vannella sp., Strain DIVA3 517/6/12" /NCGR_SAMPLE_ID=MMETSP0168 /ASSEMBLY_ACC=CAM_ASM_000044 /LENGTH=215 /DNA_ID=CAMNT_0001845829 /DNA_START=13 /DNA_END=660 /DNA_ORIENTATION=+